MALHDVTTETIRYSHCPFEVDAIAGLHHRQAGTRNGLVRDIGLPPIVTEPHHRQAAAVDRDRLADRDIVEHLGGSDAQPAVVERFESPEFFHDSCEHSGSFSR